MDEGGEKLILFRLDQQDKEAKDSRDRNTKTLERVFEQVTKTNGRVSALEKWRWLLTGGFITLTTLIGWYIALYPHK